MGFGTSPLVPMTVDDSPVMSLFPSSRWAVGQVQHGVQNELTLYVAPTATLGRAHIPWRRLADVPDAVTHFDVRGDDVYLLTHRHASRYEVIRQRLSDAAWPRVRGGGSGQQQSRRQLRRRKRRTLHPGSGRRPGRLRRMPWASPRWRTSACPLMERSVNWSRTFACAACCFVSPGGHTPHCGIDTMPIRPTIRYGASSAGSGRLQPGGVGRGAGTRAGRDNESRCLSCTAKARPWIRCTRPCWTGTGPTVTAWSRPSIPPGSRGSSTTGSTPWRMSGAEASSAKDWHRPA